MATTTIAVGRGSGGGRLALPPTAMPSSHNCRVAPRRQCRRAGTPHGPWALWPCRRHRRDPRTIGRVAPRRQCPRAENAARAVDALALPPPPTPSAQLTELLRDDNADVRSVRERCERAGPRHDASSHNRRAAPRGRTAVELSIGHGKLGPAAATAAISPSAPPDDALRLLWETRFRGRGGPACPWPM